MGTALVGLEVVHGVSDMLVMTKSYMRRGVLCIPLVAN